MPDQTTVNGADLPPGLAEVRATMDAAEAWGARPDALDQALSGLDTSDTSNAKRFLRRFGRNFVFLAPRGDWHWWSGKAWEPDPLALKVRAGLAESAEAIFGEVHHLENPKVKKSRVHWATKSKDQHRIKSAMLMAEVFRNEPANDYDQKPLLFNADNGTVELDTGLLRPHRQEDRLTLLSPTPLQKEGTPKAWLAFLEDIFGARWDEERDPNDDPLEGIQRLLGYTLSGLTTEQIMVCLHGGGSNGKSVLLEVVTHILGTYAATLRAEALMSRDRPASHQSDLVRLRGKRFVTTVESEDGHSFNESLVKQLTGGDTVSAREIFKATEEFKPEFTLWLGSNHLPHIRGGDYGIWRRIILIPMLQRFVDAEEAGPGDKIKDPHLKARLLAEAPLILGWMVHGFKMYRRDGLKVPRRWREAAEDYKTREDRFGAWFAERCTRDPAARTAVPTLKTDFDEWAKGEGDEPMTPQAFGRALSDRGFRRLKTNGLTLAIGVRLTEGLQPRQERADLWG